MVRPCRSADLGAAMVLACVACVVLGCAPIDVTNTVTIRPRAGPSEQFGGEQLSAREFVADYVQIDARLLIEIHELQSCVTTRHVPVLRVEKVHRTNRGFVIWDFALGTFTGGFAALAFAQPRLFSDRLIDGTGREVYDYTSAYVVGGVFAAISAGLLAAGIVDAHRSRDTTRYAAAFEVELGPEQACADSQPTPLSERALRLIVDGGAIELEVVTDATGRARFELPAWTASVPAAGRLPAVIEIATHDGADIEPRVLVLSLRAPFAGMTDAHTGFADTRRSAPRDESAPIELIEGPRPP